MQSLHSAFKQNLYRLYSYSARTMAPITFASLQGIPLSYASCSIGCRPSDTLPRKLEAISKAGFISIELSFPDIINYGTYLLGHPIQPNDYSELLIVCSEIRKICEANKLTIMMLQPFANFEGWPKGSAERQDAFSRARVWIEIMRTVGTDLLQVCLTSILILPVDLYWYYVRNMREGKANRSYRPRLERRIHLPTRSPPTVQIWSAISVN